MSDCIFCAIVNGKIPSHKVFEDDDYIAFLDIYPAALGHTLVIPKRHFLDIHEMSGNDYGALASCAKKIADLIHTTLNTDGITIMQMNRSAGWQSVFHAHFHVIPRFVGDKLNQPWEPVPASQVVLAEIHSRIISG